MLAWLCLGYTSVAFSQFFHHAQVGDVSDSGKSIILDRGMVEGMRPGMKARFYNDESQMDYIGVGEVIKVNDSYSFWYFRNVPETLKPKANQKIFFSMQEEVLRGRRPIKVVQTKSVKTRNRKSISADNSVPNDLIKESEDYVEGEVAVTTQPTVNYDLKTIEETEWSGGGIPIISDDFPGELESVRPKDEPTLSDSGDIREQYKSRTANDMIEGAVDKARVAKSNNSDGQIAGTVRLEGQLTNSIQNDFSKYQDKLVSQKELAQETRSRIRKNGELWSAGLTDNELRRTIVESGVIEERERRRKAAANLASHHVNLRYSTSVTPKTSNIDPNNSGNNFEMALGYEYLLEHMTESLSSWSIEGLVQRGITYQDVGGGGINGRIAWGALGLQVHWFPLWKPTAIRKFIPFVGAGIKRGNGDLQSSFLNQAYDVQLVGTDLHAGLRFRFSAGDEVYNSSPLGLGFIAMISGEQNRFNTTTGLQDRDDIDTVFELSEVRYTFGISAFF